MTARPHPNPIDVPCIACGSLPGSVCLDEYGRIFAPSHTDRRILRGYAEIDHPAWRSFETWIMTPNGRRVASIASPTWPAFSAGWEAHQCAK